MPKQNIQSERNENTNLQQRVTRRTYASPDHSSKDEPNGNADY